MPNHAGAKGVTGRLEDVGTVGRPGEGTVELAVALSGHEALLRISTVSGARAGLYLSPAKLDELARLVSQARQRLDHYAGGYVPPRMHP